MKQETERIKCCLKEFQDLVTKLLQMQTIESIDYTNYIAAIEEARLELDAITQDIADRIKNHIPEAGKKVEEDALCEK